MGYSFTLNGRTWTDTDLEPFGYRDAFPVIMADFATLIGRATADYQAFGTAVASGPVAGVQGLTGAVSLPDGCGRLINGDFRLAQRQATATFASGSQYVCDRWLVTATTLSSAATISQVVAQDTALDEAISAYLQVDLPAGTGTLNIQQRIEDARAYGGKRSIMKIKVWSLGATTIDRISVGRNYGTGGSAADTAVLLPATSLVAGWQVLTVQIPATDISAKTIGANSFVNIQIQPRLNGSSSDAKTLRFGRIWIDDTTSTSQYPTGGRFPDLPPGQGQGLAERYYERVPIDAAFYASAAGQQIVVPLPFKNRKRATPALSFATAGTLTNATAALAASADPTGGAKLTLTAAAAGLVSIAGAIVAADAEL